LAEWCCCLVGAATPSLLGKTALSVALAATRNEVAPSAFTAAEQWTTACRSVAKVEVQIAF